MKKMVEKITYGQCDDVKGKKIGPVDLGQIFQVKGGPCDWTPVKNEVCQFKGQLAGLVGRSLESREFKELARSLRVAFHAHRPFTNGEDVDKHLYETPWVALDGRRICLHIVIKLRCSIDILGARVKMTTFELCDETGQVFDSPYLLPFLIDNLSEFSYGLRNLFHGRFPDELLGKRILDGWRAQGSPENLPLTVWLDELPDGRELLVRFHLVKECGDGGVPHVKAVPVVDGGEVELTGLLPALFKKVSLEAFNREALTEFSVRSGFENGSLAAFRFRMAQVWDYLETFQRRRIGGRPSIANVRFAGKSAVVFHTGAYCVEDGEGLYGLCHNMGVDGRWQTVEWYTGAELRALDIDTLPPAPNWDLELQAFDPTATVRSVSTHVLDHASRWVPNEALLAGKDVFGRDQFVDEEARVHCLDLAQEVLQDSLVRAAADPSLVAYGYYNPVADRAAKGRSRVSPIAIYLPAYFTAEARAMQRPTAVFALRAVAGSRGVRFDVPTILPLEYLHRTIAVLGREEPGWLAATFDSTLAA